ncbi:MAG TPA: RibD family protein [Methanotrichaceae archaeon]|nr:RibD family protein [Methanotrichaceae archaeon]
MLPHIILHNAMSIDGRTDGIDPDLGQFYEIASRWREDATLAGSETILKALEDMPADDVESELESTTFGPDDKRPILVVPDSRGRIKSWHRLRSCGYWRDILSICSHTTPKSHLDYLKRAKVNCIVAGDDRVDLREALERMNAMYGVKTVRVDSGGTLNGVLLRQGLVDEISVLVHPCLVGGVSPRSIFMAQDLTSPEGVIQLRLTHVERLEGGVVWIRYEQVR